MKSYLTLPILLFLFLQGCQEENPVARLEFYWDQTSCGDPWINSSNGSNEETQQAIKDYLKGEGVRGAKVTSITNDGTQQDCFACHCTTGARINISVPINQKSKMIALGFQESN